MTHLEYSSFPSKSRIHIGESGQGYALRMATENHLNGLPQLKALLGKSRYATLDAADTPFLHRWFGADAQALDIALGWMQKGPSTVSIFYAGQQLGRSYFLNRSYPRICFQCLEELGHCRTTWDFCLSTACAEHQTLLSEVCPNCERAISWNRPALQVCNCRLQFVLPPDASPATRLEVQFSAWCEEQSRCTSTEPVETSHPTRLNRPPEGDLEPLMMLVWPLSLNGGMHLAFSLATAAGYEASLPCAERRARKPLMKARQCLERANALARLLGQSDKLHFRIRRPDVVIQLLADCMAGGAPAADRHMAQSILSTVLNQKRKTSWAGVNPQLSQLTLF
ncbi:TniQ family protein [Hydrogenophaga sp. R2]|uniref:TniQ family protein n=1 Tax=Hydrogenophaga sp. R2 TaxID=3132827 RepID=UPI003CEE5223